LAVIIRDEAGTQRSVLGFGGQSDAVDVHQRPESAHIIAGLPSIQKSPASAELHDVSPEDEQVAPMVAMPCLQLPQGEPE
jgi:hypothetical protein